MANEVIPIMRPAIPVYGPTSGSLPLVEMSNGCTPVGIGAKGDDIYSVIEYCYAENCNCPFDYNYYIDNDWCGIIRTTSRCEGGMYYESTPEPMVPLSNRPPYHTARCPTCDFRFEKREWLPGVAENTVDTIISANHIKPSHWNERYAKPYWLQDFVIDTNGIFALQYDRSDYYIFHLDPITYDVINEKNIFTNVINSIWGLGGYKPVAMAGNGTTLYMIWANGWGYPPEYFKLVYFDIGTWDITNVIDINDDLVKYDEWWTIYKLAGDGLNGYVYSLTVNFWFGYGQYKLEKRAIDPSQGFAIVDSINLTEVYYDTGEWAWNPAYDAYAAEGVFRIWCFGGDSNRLFAAGLDCIEGDPNPIFYEFDPNTLEYVGKSDICKTITPIQITSFW